MNALPKKFSTVSFAAIASCLTVVSFAQDYRADRATTSTTAYTDLSQGVYIPSIDAEDRGLRRYDGQKLLNTEGATLGTIKDLILHVPSSQVRYVVVSSGGVLGGIGNRLRLVPIEAVRQGRQAKTLEVDILQSAWLRVPPVNDEDYVADRFNISPAQHQEMVRQFGTAHPVGAASAAMATPQAAASGLIRGSALTGKRVVAGGVKVGNIENIIIEIARSTAAALLDSAGEFTGTSTKYLIPLSSLVIENRGQNPISTTLTRADFDRARPSSFTPAVDVAVAPPRVISEPPLPPTGRMNSEAVATTPASDPLAASARAVRRVIDSDPALVAERVQVLPENGRVVLSGSVRDQFAKNKLDEIARRVLPAGNIENRVIVDSR